MKITDSTIFGVPSSYAEINGPQTRNLSIKTTVNMILFIPSKFPNKRYSEKMNNTIATWFKAPKSRGQIIKIAN